MKKALHVSQHHSPEFHTIRLRGPWTCQWAKGAAGSSENLSEPLRFNAPNGLAEVLLPLVPQMVPGRLLLRRAFHAPAGLANSPRVDLVFTAAYPGSIWLNGQHLSDFDPGECRCEIGERLQPNLQLLIELYWDAGNATAPTCEAWLEIH